MPWFACVLRRSYGVAQGIHLGPGATVVAWPSAMSGALPVESGVELAFRREIEAADAPDARRAELEDEMAVGVPESHPAPGVEAPEPFEDEGGHVEIDGDLLTRGTIVFVELKEPILPGKQAPDDLSDLLFDGPPQILG